LYHSAPPKRFVFFLFWAVATPYLFQPVDVAWLLDQDCISCTNLFGCGWCRSDSKCIGFTQHLLSVRMSSYVCGVVFQDLFSVVLPLFCVYPRLKLLTSLVVPNFQGRVPRHCTRALNTDARVHVQCNVSHNADRSVPNDVFAALWSSCACNCICCHRLRRCCSGSKWCWNRVSYIRCSGENSKQTRPCDADAAELARSMQQLRQSLQSLALFTSSRCPTIHHNSDFFFVGPLLYTHFKLCFCFRISSLLVSQHRRTRRLVNELAERGSMSLILMYVCVYTCRSPRDWSEVMLLHQISRWLTPFIVFRIANKTAAGGIM
jgi:hypothetical protein